MTYKQAFTRLEVGGEVRNRVLRLFREAGGSRDRWVRTDRRAMAEAITRVEDELENEHKGRMTAGRLALRSLRRELELGAW